MGIGQGIVEYDSRHYSGRYRSAQRIERDGVQTNRHLPRSETRGQDATLLVLKEHPEASRSWTFDKYWDEVCIRFTESTARQLGVLDECRARGIGGLLEIPCVRMAIGLSASLMFAQVQGTAVQKPRPQDSRDLQHAVMAAARASIFVTDDTKLMRLVSHVPMNGFETARLPEFLARLTTN
jgi:hypothetical protein